MTKFRRSHASSDARNHPRCYRCIRAIRLSVCALLSLICANLATGQITQRVSLATDGTQGNEACNYYVVSISADGRFVAFTSRASTFVGGDTNGWADVFVRDRQNGTTERISVSSAGEQANGNSEVYGGPTMSPDARYVGFSSQASNLVSGDTNGVADVFLRDRQLNLTERVSLDSSGSEGNGDSGNYRGISISADGRYVAFVSTASNLVVGDTNAVADIFVRDRQNGTTVRVNLDSNGLQADGWSYDASISADGRYVAFWSYAANLVSGDTNNKPDVFVRDLLMGTTERVSIDSGGIQGNGLSISPTLSTDGRYVAFTSDATNLVPGDTNGAWDVFVHDRQAGITERVDLSTTGVQANLGFGPSELSLSADGRFVAFSSAASNLVSGDTNIWDDIFVRDRQLGRTERVSVSSSGTPENNQSTIPAISADGRFIAFWSSASNLVSGDTNGFSDIFVRDRFGVPQFTSLCDPGVGGVIACPCSNPPNRSSRGCDNSASTGGAILSAAGGTYLSSDSLVFTTSGEKPTATSVLLQGTAVNAAGAVYGQGVRCVAGTLKRLFTKSASGGSITAPNFGAGDPTVSARSAAKGNPISAGQSRWYLVFYRDPTVLGGCPSGSTFNATQTGQITWTP